MADARARACLLVTSHLCTIFQKHKVDVNLEDEDGETPLSVCRDAASCSRNKTNFVAMIDLLVKVLPSPCFKPFVFKCQNKRRCVCVPRGLSSSACSELHRRHAVGSCQALVSALAAASLLLYWHVGLCPSGCCVAAPCGHTCCTLAVQPTINVKRELMIDCGCSRRLVPRRRRRETCQIEVGS